MYCVFHCKEIMIMWSKTDSSNCGGRLLAVVLGTCFFRMVGVRDAAGPMCYSSPSRAKHLERTGGWRCWIARKKKHCVNAWKDWIFCRYPLVFWMDEVKLSSSLISFWLGEAVISTKGVLH